MEETKIIDVTQPIKPIVSQCDFNFFVCTHKNILINGGLFSYKWWTFLL